MVSERVERLLLPQVALGVIILLIATRTVIVNRHQPSTLGLSGNTTWIAGDGRFLQYSVPRNKLTYFLISMLPEGEVQLIEQDSQRAGTLAGSTLNIRITNTRPFSIRLRREAVFLVINSAGRTFAGPCPLELEELQELVKALANDASERRSQAQVLEIARRFIEPQRERWPADLLSEIGMD